jgi:predicted porin
MKKSLLALALLGAFAGVASAQSSVTIYGTVDESFGRGNGGTATNGNAYGTSKAYQIANNGHQSRLGFRGNEDLGGGLSAQFLLETRLNPDTGTQVNANAFWQGQSYVKLTSKQAGSVVLGRFYTPTFNHLNRLDPFAWDGVARMGDAQYGGYQTPDPAGISAAANATPGTSIRTPNSVGYDSPVFAGFSVHGSGSLSEATNLGRAEAVSATYEAGPLYVGVTGEKVYKGVNHGQGIWSIGGSYDLGVTKLYGLFARSTFNLSGPASNGATPAHLIGGPTGPGTAVPGGTNGLTRAHVYEIGALTPIGGGNLKTGYIRDNPKGSGNTRQKFGLGYDYFLSKRTKIYLDGSYAKEEFRTNNKAIALGIRHDF